MKQLPNLLIPFQYLYNDFYIIQQLRWYNGKIVTF